MSAQDDFDIILQTALEALPETQILIQAQNAHELERTKLSLNMWVDYWPIPSRFLEYFIRSQIDAPKDAEGLTEAIKKILPYAPPIDEPCKQFLERVKWL